MAVACNAMAVEPGPGVYTTPSVKASASCKPPVYHETAVRREAEGISLVALLVKADGTTSNKAVLYSSSHSDLDQEVLTALARCAFQPGRAGDTPTDMWFPFQYKWKLDDAGDSLRSWTARKAATGDAAARFQLRMLLGESQDHKRALTLLRSAAEQGYPAAQFALGEQYEMGRHVERDEAEALKWYQQAAEKGDVLAVQRLKLGALPLHPNERKP